MSYRVSLIDPTKSEDVQVKVDPHTDGADYKVGGSTDAQMSITGNYSECYRLFDFHPREMDGKTAEATITLLESLVGKLGTKQYQRDYWAPTPGNAGYALNVLLGWARQHPEGVWSVSQ